MKFSRTNKVVHFEINGKRYDRIEDVPPEFREMLRALNNNPEALKKGAVTKVTTASSVNITDEPEERPHEDFREKFLHETVLPNLHLMDPKAQAEVLRAMSGDSEKQPSPRSTLFWIVLYAALGLFLMFGYSAVKNMFSAP